MTALGCFTNVLYNLPEPILVGLWDSNGILLASNSIASDGQLVDQSLYEPIAPVSLSLGHTYYVGAISSAGLIVGRAVDGQSGFAGMAPEILLGFLAYETNTPVLSFPLLTDNGPSGSAFLAPNFEFSVVPEPSSCCLVFTGMAIAAARLRRYIPPRRLRWRLARFLPCGPFDRLVFLRGQTAEPAQCGWLRKQRFPRECLERRFGPPDRRLPVRDQ